MTGEDRYTRHARLVSKMADRVGLDLVEGMQRGEIDSEDIREIVHLCTGCIDPEACSKLLASDAKIDNPPEFCRNAKKLSQG
jgi:hypothetical protein